MSLKFFDAQKKKLYPVSFLFGLHHPASQLNVGLKRLTLAGARRPGSSVPARAPLPPAAGSRSSSASPKPAPAALGSATKAGLRLVHVCRAAKRGAALPGSTRLPGAAGWNGGRRRVPSPCLSPASGALRAAPRTPRPPPAPASPPPRSRCGSTGTRPSFCSRRRRRCGSGST